MTHQICDACECVSLCSKSGCRPLVPMDQAPVVTPVKTSEFIRAYVQEARGHLEVVHQCASHVPRGAISADALSEMLDCIEEILPKVPQ